MQVPRRTRSYLLGANRPDVLLIQGEAHIAEPRPGDPDPFPAVTGLGSGSDVGKSGVQLRQFQAPFSSRVEVPARDGFVQEPFSFAVVIRTVHSVLFGRKYSEVLWQGRWCLLLQSVIVICVARKVTALAVGVGLLELGEPKCVRELVELCR